MSEMARAERALARRSENRALRDMIKNLSRSGFGDSKSLFCNAAPSQSLFAAPRYASTPLGGKRKLGAIQTPESYYRRYKGTPNGSTSRKKRPRRDPEQEWNQRCARIFQKVMRANASREFPHYATKQQALQCTTIRLDPSIMPKSCSQEDMIALFWQIGEQARRTDQLDITRTPYVTFDAVRAMLLTPIFGARLRVLQAQEQPAIDDQVMQLLAPAAIRPRD